MSFRALLDPTCTIKREDISTVDEIGGYSDTTYTVLYRRVPCRFETLTKKLEIIAYNKEAVFPDYYVYMEYWSGIKEGDILEKDGRTFEIKLVENWSEAGKYMKLAVVELGRD